MLPFEYSSLADANDAKQLGRILAQCFNSPPDREGTYLNRIGWENFRVIRQADQMAGGLAGIPMGQWWGQQCIPMVGVAAVGIAPEYRGSGAAIALLQHLLRELHANGTPISVLYPATQRLYRKVGYEQGGAHHSWEIATDAIQLKDRSMPLQRVAIDAQPIRDLYAQQAMLSNGYLKRHSAIWQGLTDANSDAVYAYLVGEPESPQGYVLFSQRQDGDGAKIRIRDWVALSVDAARRLWTFMADHRSQISSIRWSGGAVDPLLLPLPEQSARIRSMMYWLLRIVHVKAALEQRGYPPNLQVELHLSIDDELLPENTGRYILSVANGRGEVTQGGNGDMTLNIRGLAPLYTGLYTPQQLQLTGYLDATETALATASQLFSGTSPWMPDFF
jgi:predicted acetyltransferase